MMEQFRGFGIVLRADLRRDTILLPTYALVFALVAAGSAAATSGVYPDERSRVQGAELINATPALLAMYGRIYDPTSEGAVGVIKMIGMGTALVALISAFVVIRHTRADEELGRHELLASGSLGRFSVLAAALVVAVLGAGAIGIATAVGLTACGLPIDGSLAFGWSWLGAGIAFAGIGALAAQLTTSARTSRALTVAALAAAYLLRAAGDTGGGAEPDWPTWLSPIGWAQQIRPYAGDRWLVGLLPLVLGFALAIAAGALARHRDLGSGLLPHRPGPAHGPAWLAGPVALAWRQQRGAFFGWLAAFVLLSMVLAQILTRIGDLLDSPVARQLITELGGIDELADAFLAVELSFIGVFAAAYGISATLRLVGEESSIRAELVLAHPVSRARWGASHLVLALAGTGLLMLACGLALGLIQMVQTGELDPLGADLAAAAVRLPAAWVLVGVAIALDGVHRRAAPASWAILVATFVTSEFGALLDLPEWVRDLSPFSYVPQLPGGDVAALPLLVLLGVAILLCGGGLWALGRRDLATG